MVPLQFRLKVLSDCIWREEAVPDDWHKQLLISLHKRASCLDCDNYHGIALLSIPSKVFDTAILNCGVHIVSGSISMGFAMAAAVKITFIL